MHIIFVGANASAIVHYVSPFAPLSFPQGTPHVPFAITFGRAAERGGESVL
jgi:hypothetical protein